MVAVAVTNWVQSAGGPSRVQEGGDATGDRRYGDAPLRPARLRPRHRSGGRRGRAPGESIVAALRRLQAGECPRLCSPGFATFARIIEESPTLQAKELEVMARLNETLAAAIRDELRIPEIDAKIAANMLIGVHWQLFRNARTQALAGRQGPAAVRRLRSDLDRAYRLLEHGLGALEPAGSQRLLG